MAKTKTTTKTAKPSGADLLAQMAGKTKPAKSKSKTPIFVVSDEAEVKNMVAIVTAKRKEKAAKSESEVAQDKFRATATAHFEGQCQADNALHSSLKFTADLDGEAHSLTFTQKKMCKNMLETETSDELHTIFRDEFDAHFEAARTIQIDTSALTDAQITAVLGGIQKALKFTDDPATYDAAIGVVAMINPKESFFRDRILNPDFRKLAMQAAQEDLAVPHSPSFKL